MSDILDNALEIEIRDRGAAIEHVRQKLHKPGTKNCVACGDEIPEVRREKVPYATRCVDCQTNFEKKKRVGQ